MVCNEDLLRWGLILKYCLCYMDFSPVPVAARSMAWVCDRSLARIAVRIQKGHGCECCVMSGRGPCVGLISHPEDSYRV
jgi:hypothetical protein